MNKNCANLFLFLTFYFYLLAPSLAVKKYVEFSTEDRLEIQQKRRIEKQERLNVIRDDNEGNENKDFCDFFAMVCNFFCSGPRIRF